MSNQLGPGLPSQAAVIICFQLCCLLFNITFWLKVSPDSFSTFRSSFLPQFYLQIYLNSIICLHVPSIRQPVLLPLLAFSTYRPSQLLSEWCNSCYIMFGPGTYRNIDWTVLSWSGYVRIRWWAYFAATQANDFSQYEPSSCVSLIGIIK